MSGTIVFDFDGTLAVGTGPIVAYACALAEASDPAFFARASAEIAAFESGESDYRDGYHAVGALALAEGIDPVTLESAYRVSRAALGTPDVMIESPKGLAALLERLRASARLVLATNAPAEGVTRVLEQWGIEGFFSATHFGVGKPQGLHAVIRDALRDGPVLSVGDIVEFDLAPAMELGADTALVGVTAERSSAPVTMRGRTVADIAPDIENWAAAAAENWAAAVASSIPESTTPTTERHP